MTDSRRSIARLVAGATLVLALALAACQPAATPEQEQVRAALNASRTAQRLPALLAHGQAQSKAQAWAEKLARDGRLSHSRLSDGISVRWCNLGENVGMGGSIAAVQNAYMSSPDHRNNILDTKWTGVGTGYAKRGTTVYTVQVFIRTC